MRLGTQLHKERIYISTMIIFQKLHYDLEFSLEPFTIQLLL
jgi:hypothetical protein